MAIRAIASNDSKNNGLIANVIGIEHFILIRTIILFMNLNSNNKRLAKNSIIMYIQVVLNLVIGLFTGRYVLQILGESDFGTYNVVGGFVSMMVILCNPMMTGAQRFFAYDLGKGVSDQLRKDFNTTNIIYWLLAIMIFVILETFGLWFVNNKMTFEVGRMGAVNWVYQFSVIAFVFNVLAIPYNAILLAHENVAVGAILEIGQKIFQFVAIVLLWIIPYDSLILYSALLCIVAIFARIIPTIYCHRHYPETHIQLQWDRDYFKSIMEYTGYNSIGVVAIVGMGQGLNVLLNMFFMPAINAARGISSNLSGIVQSFTTNIYMPSRPQIVKYYAAGETDVMWDLVSRLNKIMFLVSMLLSVPLFFEIDFVLSLWLGEYPDYTTEFVQLTIIANLFTVCGMMLTGVLQAANRIKLQQLSVAILNLLILPISYILLKFGCSPVTPFVVIIFLNIISLLTSIWVTGKELKVSMFFYFKIIASLFASLLIASIIPFIECLYIEEGLFRFMVVGVTSAITCILSILFISFNNKERNYIVQQTSNIINKYVHLKSNKSNSL